MMKLLKVLLGILLLVTACTTKEIIPPTRVVLKETVTTPITVSPESTNALAVPSATPIFTPLPTATFIASPIPTLLPTPTPLSVPTSEFVNSELQFSIVDQFGGRMQAIDVAGDKAYIGVGPRLQVIDIADPNSPQFLGQSEAFPSMVQDIDIVDDIAYVALGQGGVRIMDVSDPTNITVKSAFGFDGQYGRFDLTVDENVLYGVGSNYGGGGRVYLYDVTDASNPVHLTADTYPSVYTETPPVIVNGYLYTIGNSSDNKSHELNIFSYDDPLTPKLEGSVTVEGAYSYFTVVDNLLYLISYAINKPDALKVIDITDPTQPFVVGELTIDDPRDPGDIAVVNGYAYVLDNQYTGTPCGYEVYIFDVSDPTNVQEVNLMSQAMCSDEFVVVDNQFYIAEPHQMRILDVSSPTELTEIGRYAVPLAAGQPTRILTVNSNAYVFEAIEETLSIWDISNSRTPTALASPMPLIGGGAFGVANDLLYVPGWKSFRVFSLADLAQPELIVDEPGGVHSATGEPAGIVATGISLELVNSESIPVASALNQDSEGYVGVIFTQPDRFIYVASRKALPFEPEYWQLEIYDATNPAGLELVGVTPLPGMTRTITTKDNYVYVIWGEDYSSGRPDAILGELLVIDVSDMASPQIVASLPLPPHVTTATIKGDYLYFGVFDVYNDSISGLYAINISTPSHPYLAGFKQLADGVQSIAQVDDLFYIASGDGGVHLLETNR